VGVAVGEGEATGYSGDGRKEGEKRGDPLMAALFNKVPGEECYVIGVRDAWLATTSWNTSGLRRRRYGVV